MQARSATLALPSTCRPAQGLTLVCGRFCLGSNKVMQVALGKDAETEIQDGLAELASRISGSVGLLFTSMPQQEVSSCLPLKSFAAICTQRCTAPHLVDMSQAGLVRQFRSSLVSTLDCCSMLNAC